jgi:GNAT superfamily N-acetyltransferase
MITYQQESFTDVIDEIKHLLVCHYSEICAFDKDRVKLNPNWDIYKKLDKDKSLFIYTCRNELKLVGYYISFLYSHHHYSDILTSNSDIIFVDTNYRKGMVGYKLIRKAEQRLKELGISMVLVSIKTKGNLHKLIERLGYSPLDSIYYKEI